jgi:hypothetical protein
VRVGAGVYVLLWDIDLTTCKCCCSDANLTKLTMNYTVNTVLLRSGTLLVDSPTSLSLIQPPNTVGGLHGAEVAFGVGFHFGLGSLLFYTL